MDAAYEGYSSCFASSAMKHMNILVYLYVMCIYKYIPFPQSQSGDITPIAESSSLFCNLTLTKPERWSERAVQVGPKEAEQRVHIGRHHSNLLLFVCTLLFLPNTTLPHSFGSSLVHPPQSAHFPICTRPAPTPSLHTSPSRGLTINERTRTCDGRGHTQAAQRLDRASCWRQAHGLDQV